jgi:hypothetical protein
MMLLTVPSPKGPSLVSAWDILYIHTKVSKRGQRCLGVRIGSHGSDEDAVEESGLVPGGATGVLS